jgi:TolB protein
LYVRVRKLSTTDFAPALVSLSALKPGVNECVPNLGEPSMKLRCALLTLLFLVVGLPSCTLAQQPAIGIFDGHSDVGKVVHPGGVSYDAAQHAYTVTGSGENIWVSPDAFQFVWKKVSGDFALTADVALLSAGGNPHRKAVLMVRKSLDADSVYADIALHGEGLTSLQFRDEKGGATREVQSSMRSPKRLRLVKRGDYVYMALGEGESLQIAGGSPRIPLEGTYYVGIGVCAHDKDAIEKAEFSRVELKDRTASSSATPAMYSVLETVTIASGDRKAVYVTPEHIEAPNWTRDGSAFLFNSNGRINRLPVGSARPEIVDTGFATQCNNDHGISPDGKTLVISDNSQGKHGSLIYTLPLSGGTPKRITQESPSYWHGWSPDEKTLAFVGERNGEFDIYAISVEGGTETRLTTAKGLDDGPEYTPDGKYIYFNSERTGRMQIWRMAADGSRQEQVTFGDYNDWFPHFSPDGRFMAFLSYEKDVSGHPPNKDVILRVMSMSDGKVAVVARLFGGQGTMNVPSWSPDGTKFAYVSFVFVDPDDARSH